jgi:uncharacterized small protein (DUF1192 family)
MSRDETKDVGVLLCVSDDEDEPGADTSIVDGADWWRFLNEHEQKDHVRYSPTSQLDELEKRIAELESEVKRVRSLIALDRTGLAQGLNSVRKLIKGFAWLANDGEWGCYAYEDHNTRTLRREIEQCFDQVLDVVDNTLKASGDVADSAVQGKLKLLPIVEDRSLAQRIAGVDHEISRCRDGCENWKSFCGLVMVCTHERGLGHRAKQDGSDFCSYHTRLKK